MIGNSSSGIRSIIFKSPICEYWTDKFLEPGDNVIDANVKFDEILIQLKADEKKHKNCYLYGKEAQTRLLKF